MVDTLIEKSPIRTKLQKDYKAMVLGGRLAVEKLGYIPQGNCNKCNRTGISGRKEISEGKKVYYYVVCDCILKDMARQERDWGKKQEEKDSVTVDWEDGQEG